MNKIIYKRMHPAQGEYLGYNKEESLQNHVQAFKLNQQLYLGLRLAWQG